MSNDLPLDGVQVIDLTRLLPGPLATRHLAEMGATILKIEGPAAAGQDDGSRYMGLSHADVEAGRIGPIFSELNRGKELLRLDLRSPEGRAALLRRAAAADVLIEGFRPGVMQRLGLGFGAHPLRHWVALFENVDACVTPVLRLDEALAHPLISSSPLSTVESSTTL